jgi:hypothetical protein
MLHRPSKDEEAQSAAEHARQMPILPLHRPRVLTPSPLAAVKPETDCGPESAIAPFFRCLPLDLRRQILIEAFGSRIVHMDLTFDHPKVAPSLTDMEPNAQEGVITRHCGLQCESSMLLHSPLKVDTSRPKAWQWFSCVCHRDPEYRSRGDNEFVSEPWTDGCRTGAASWCRGWPGDVPQKCFLGAMGWLLACRQA